MSKEESSRSRFRTIDLPQKKMAYQPGFKISNLNQIESPPGDAQFGMLISLGGGVLVHQFCQIGAQVFIGGGFRVVQDVPPYILAAKEPLKYQGINSIGLKRRGYDQKTRKDIKEIYQIVFGASMNISQAIIEIKNKFKDSNHRNMILNFIKNSKRGII